MVRIFWISEYQKASQIIPQDDPYRDRKIGTLKELIISNFIILNISFIVLGFVVYTSIRVSHYNAVLIIGVIPFLIWILNLVAYFIFRKYHISLVRLKTIFP